MLNKGREQHPEIEYDNRIGGNDIGTLCTCIHKLVTAIE